MTPRRDEDDDHLMPQAPFGHIDRWESVALDYVDGHLAPSALDAVEAHLSGCPVCREALAEQGRMAARLRAVEPVEVPAFLEAQVLAASLREARLPTPTPIGHRRSAQSGGVRRYLDGITRRPWVPAAIAATVVLVALAGSSDPIRSGGGADTVAPDARSSTGAGQAVSAVPGSDAGKSTPTTWAAASSTTDLNAGTNAGTSADTGDTVVSSEVLASATTAPPVAPNVPSPAGYGSQDPTEAVAATGDTMAATDSGALPVRDAASLPSAVWVNLEAPAGNAGAAVTVEQTTGLQALLEPPAVAAPVYATLIRRGDLEAILQYLADAGLIVTLADAQGPQLDQVLSAVALQTSDLALMEAVSPQGNTLSASTLGLSTDSPSDYLMLILAPVR